MSLSFGSKSFQIPERFFSTLNSFKPSIFSIVMKSCKNNHIVILKLVIWYILKFGLSEKLTKFEKIFLVVLTNQLIYLVNIKTMTKIFFQIMCASQKVWTLKFWTQFFEIENIFWDKADLKTAKYCPDSRSICKWI